MSLDYFISLYWIFSGLSHLLIFPSGRIRKENLGRIHLTHQARNRKTSGQPGEYIASSLCKLGSFWWKSSDILNTFVYFCNLYTHNFTRNVPLLFDSPLLSSIWIFIDSHFKVLFLKAMEIKILVHNITSLSNLYQCIHNI